MNVVTLYKNSTLMLIEPPTTTTTKVSQQSVIEVPSNIGVN